MAFPIQAHDEACGGVALWASRLKPGLTANLVEGCGQHSYFGRVFNFAEGHDAISLMGESVMTSSKRPLPVIGEGDSS
jgi:hypothetical protein